MERTRVWRWTLGVSVLVLALVSVLALLRPLRAQGAKGTTAVSDRPGDGPYTPTKLEWAALELQANFGRNWTNEDHTAIGYMPDADGKTVRCILQYTPDVSAQDLKTSRDVARLLFDRYQAGRGWPWLRLRFEERTLPPPHSMTAP